MSELQEVRALMKLLDEVSEDPEYRQAQRTERKRITAVMQEELEEGNPTPEALEAVRARAVKVRARQRCSRVQLTVTLRPSLAILCCPSNAWSAA